MSYRVLILEDEFHAQKSLESLLAVHPKFKVQAVASSLEEAKFLIEADPPDLVFCDVLLPPYTSLDWLQTLDQIPFDIIFTTSYEEYAVKAFRLAAVDYLIKPIIKEELKTALDKFLQKKDKNTGNIQQLMSNLRVPKSEARIALPTFSGYLFVDIKEIVRCESDNTYTTFYFLGNRKILVSKTLKEYELLLTEYRFCRIHNSHLINLDFLEEYIRGEGGQVRMKDGAVVDVSRRRKESFLRMLKYL